MLKVIFFDATGTLIKVTRTVGWHYREEALVHGLDLSSESFGTAFRRVFKSMPPRPASPGPRPADDAGWWRELVGKVIDSVLAEAGVVPPARFDVESFFRDLYRRFSSSEAWEVYPDVKPAIQALRSRFKLGVISNFDARLRPVLTGLGLIGFFDYLVISSEVGADKPDPFIFRRALELAGVQPSEALHAGDDSADWDGAENAGLRSFRLHRPENSLADLCASLR